MENKEKETEKKTLEVGDRVYCRQGYGGGNLSGYDTIERVTKTQAIGSKGTRYRREIRFENMVDVPGRSSFSSISYLLETPEIKREWGIVKMRRDIKDIAHKVLNDSQVERLHKVVKEVLKELEKENTKEIS